MRDYLRRLKLIMDNLGIYGEKISDAEHIATILNGLPSEFDSMVTLITTSWQAYDVLALSSMLIDLEARQKSGVVVGLFSVNLVTSQSTSYGAQGYQQPAEGMSNLVGYQGRGGSFHQGRGRGRFSNRPQWQLCGKIGHTVQKCYYRFNTFFIGFPELNAGHRCASANFAQWVMLMMTTNRM